MLQVELLQNSFDKIKPAAEDFVSTFYENLFEFYPEAKPLFANTDMEQQQEKLLKSLSAVILNLRYPENLKDSLQVLGKRHVDYGTLPSHYPLVGHALLTTFEEFLGDEWTADVKQAWVEAYQSITELMLSGTDYTPEEISLESVAGTIDNTILEEQEEGLKVALLQSSFEKVKPQADAFVDGFYSNLFSMYPSAKPLFEHTKMGMQKKMLLDSLVLTVDNLDNPEVLTEKLQGLGARHVKYGALPEHYPLVGNALLTTFEQFLVDDWTEDVKQAWVEAYGAITELMLSGADYTDQEISLDSVVEEQEEKEKEEGLKVSILQSSFEKITPQADAFVDSFYSNLFSMYPSAKPLFEHTKMGMQKKMLLDSLVLTVNNLDNPDVLTKKLQGLGARHVKYGALPEHYPLVGNALLTTFEQYLADDWTEDVKQAWVEAYGAITDLMLSGADYTAEEVSLDSIPEGNNDQKLPTPVAVESSMNWGVFGGVFAAGGVGAILLLLLL